MKTRRAYDLKQLDKGKSPEQLYEEREKRLRDAIQLREPDRVPGVLTTNYFPVTHLGGGLTLATSYYDYSAWREANRQTIIDYEPDAHAPGGAMPGPALELLVSKLYRWPGGSLGPNTMHQYIEGEPLKAEEYDLFLNDPGDWTLRCYLPRVWGALAPLSKLPPLQSLWGANALATQSASFAVPEVVQAFEALFRAGREAEKCRMATSGFDDEMAGLGFPALSQGNAPAPFDVISDHLRGMAGTMLDMYRCPDKLIAACELILTRSISSGAVALKSKWGNPKRVGTATHRGSDGFMSLKQFDTYYWPTFKRLMLATVEKGMVHVPFYEGLWEQRLERLLELPPGKTIARFALTDLARAKAVLGGHTCIMGGVPHVLLQVGSPQEVEEFCKNLIKTVGKGGGFILSTHTGITEEAKPANVKAMVDSVKKYGWY